MKKIRLSWKQARITLLSLCLGYVAIGAYQDVNHNWDGRTKIILHPINMDGDAKTTQYISQLKQSDFQEIEEWIETNAKKYRGKDTDVEIVLGAEIKNKPRMPTEEVAESMWKTILWSLEFRFFGVRNYKVENRGSDAVMYLAYHNPDLLKGEMGRSTALEKGRIGVTNLHINATSRSRATITHELFHIFGTEDRYDIYSGNPIYPIGYAVPHQVPLYPQKQAEIMGGYIPLSEKDFLMPERLSEFMMGPITARELKWTK